MKFLLCTLILLAVPNGFSAEINFDVECSGSFRKGGAERIIKIQLNTSSNQYLIVDQYLPAHAWPNIVPYTGRFEGLYETTFFVEGHEFAEMSLKDSSGISRSFNYAGSDESFDVQCE